MIKLPAEGLGGREDPTGCSRHRSSVSFMESAQRSLLSRIHFPSMTAQTVTVTWHKAFQLRHQEQHRDKLACVTGPVMCEELRDRCWVNVCQTHERLIDVLWETADKPMEEIQIWQQSCHIWQSSHLATDSISCSWKKCWSCLKHLHSASSFFKTEEGNNVFRLGSKCLHVHFGSQEFLVCKSVALASAQSLTWTVFHSDFPFLFSLVSLFFSFNGSSFKLFT